MTLHYITYIHMHQILQQILHLDPDIQYSLKITKSQELVKFEPIYLPISYG